MAGAIEWHYDSERYGSTNEKYHVGKIVSYAGAFCSGKPSLVIEEYGIRTRIFSDIRDLGEQLVKAYDDGIFDKVIHYTINDDDCIDSWTPVEATKVPSQFALLQKVAIIPNTNEEQGGYNLVLPIEFFDADTNVPQILVPRDRRNTCPWFIFSEPRGWILKYRDHCSSTDDLQAYENIIQGHEYIVVHFARPMKDSDGVESRYGIYSIEESPGMKATGVE